MINEWWPGALSAVCAAGLMPLAMSTHSLGLDDVDGVQKLHRRPTSRLGGFPIFAAYVVVLIAGLKFANAPLTAAVPLLLCSLPVLLAGAWEDLWGGVRPAHRLAGALFSAVLASWYVGGVVNHLDLPSVDGWLQFAIIALPVTWFMVAGACNAMNLIDGAHGLAGGTALMMFGGLAAAATMVGDTLIGVQALAMVGAIAGFLVWNYPRGKVFLGDAGAYFLGFMYAELSIQIVSRNEGISAWFVIALAAYPIVETVYSIYRRKVVAHTASMQPDAQHLHSLLFRWIAGREGGGSLTRANARVAPLLWLHGALCLVAALWLHDDTPALISFCVAYTALYIGCYRALSRNRPNLQSAAAD